MKIVFLERRSVGEDLDLSMFDTLGEVVMYATSSVREIPERIADADIVVCNKVPMDASTLDGAKQLKLVCVTATGTNNLDMEYLEQRGIAWANAAGYSTESVAQHTFAMLFYLLEHLQYYDAYVKSGAYAESEIFTHIAKSFTELKGKTWGIIGLGAIGRRVADIAKAFGAKVIYYSASGAPAQEGYEQVDFDTLLAASDILSVHAPLNAHTQHLIDRAAFARMKQNCIFLNLGRGPIVVEEDLYEALQNHVIAAAGLDVLEKEPMEPDNPLLRMQDSGRLLITPHIAWASTEARKELMHIIYTEMRDFCEKHNG